MWRELSCGNVDRAINAELEHRKQVRRVISCEQRVADKALKRELAVQKAKAKHRGK